jgi:hypothetical protein
MDVMMNLLAKRETGEEEDEREITFQEHAIYYLHKCLHYR